MTEEKREKIIKKVADLHAAFQQYRTLIAIKDLRVTMASSPAHVQMTEATDLTLALAEAEMWEAAARLNDEIRGGA